MTQILVILGACTVITYAAFFVIQAFAACTFTGKVRAIDKFIGCFDKKYKELCSKF